MGVGAVGACLRISVWRAAAAVKLGGGMVRIKNRKFSVGSAAVKVDLNFDKFATLTVMTGEAEKITAQVPVVAVNKLPTNVIGDVVVVFLSKEANAQIFSAKTAKQFVKSSSKVCDSSTNARFELCAIGAAADVLDTAVSLASGGDVVLARCVCKEDVANGFRLVLTKHSTVVLNPGGEEDWRCSQPASCFIASLVFLNVL